jgi:hypothetical protein
LFEIGSSLREARERRRFDFPRIERDTHIRAKYLRALEDEDFGVLPGPAYAKGFLRTYAEYLGLEGQRFVDEFNSRFAALDETAVPAPVRVQRGGVYRRPALIAFASLVVLALVGWLIFRGGGDEQAAVQSVAATTTTRTTAPTTTRAAAPTTARLVLVAARGPCWLSVRLGSESGRALYERTLETGETARFVARRLWIRIGAPWNLDATLNGAGVRLPTALANVVVTPTGLREQVGPR